MRSVARNRVRLLHLGVLVTLATCAPPMDNICMRSALVASHKCNTLPIYYFIMSLLDVSLRIRNSISESNAYNSGCYAAHFLYTFHRIWYEVRCMFMHQILVTHATASPDNQHRAFLPPCPAVIFCLANKNFLAAVKSRPAASLVEFRIFAKVVRAETS